MHDLWATIATRGGVARVRVRHVGSENRRWNAGELQLVDRDKSPHGMPFGVDWAVGCCRGWGRSRGHMEGVWGVTRVRMGESRWRDKSPRDDPRLFL